ncbi:MAG: 4-hydroxybenzoate octaprenyltransferase [Bacteroidia bacterium]|nr:MAG: 4-hydroxybenzoate octaprenyltransferase [Bacteroidia bacterium]
MFQKIVLYLRLIRFSHTIFAMPFAILGVAIAYQHFPQAFTWQKFLFILLCMVFARTAAMAFNRYLDKDIDKLNPRTQNREIPSNKVKPKEALLLTVVSSILFVYAARLLNPLCFYLSPVALLVVLGYSYTKRFTWLCHIILGLGLALAPVGAYMAITGEIHISVIIVSAAVLFWVSGFDIIYALQDEEFDKSYSLYSIPSFFGRTKSIYLARIFHILSSILLLINFISFGFGEIYFIGWMLFSLLLVYEHYLVRPDDISKIPFAFGTLNSWAGLIFGCLAIWDVLIK